MAICSNLCIAPLPVYLMGGCSSPIKKGGWKHAVLINCNAAIPEDPCDEAAWQALIDNCQIRVSGELVGSKDAGSDTFLRTSSCSPEKPISGTKTWSFVDYNSSLSLSEYTFWNAVKMNASSYKVGFLDCENRLYAFYDYGLSVDEVKDDNSNGTSRIGGTFTVEEVELLTPVRIPASIVQLLVDNMTYNCDTDTYEDDFSVSCESINLSMIQEAYTVINDDIATVSIGVVLDRTNCASPVPLVLEFVGVPNGVNIAPAGGDTPTLQSYNVTASGVAVGTYRINVQPVAGQTTCETNITHILLTVA